MRRVNAIESNVLFKYPLAPRQATRYFNLHWQGKMPDGFDLSKIDADMINDWHRDRGWSGIGYHYIIHTDGTVEIGRPRWAQGAHDEGENSQSLGICVIYDILPGMVQLDALINILADLHDDYHLLPADNTIKGHRDDEPPETPTECPGDGLYNLLPEIRHWVKEAVSHGA